MLVAPFTHVKVLIVIICWLELVLIDPAKHLQGAIASLEVEQQ